MAKIVLNDFANITGNETSAIATLNVNNSAIEDAIENTLSRDGTSPNAMNADFDMNGNDIINAEIIYANDAFFNGVNIENIVGVQGLPGTNGTNGTNGATGPAGPPVSDGDKGDVVVSGSGTVWTIDSASVGGAKLTNNSRDVSVNAILSASSTITTGVKGDITIPFSGTITSVQLLADAAGSIVVDLWKDTYANYPPTVADTITAAAKPTLSTANKYTDSTLTGWTTSVSAGDIIRYNVDSVSGLARVDVALTIRRS